MSAERDKHAEQVQRDVDQMGMNEDDEKAAQERLEKTGEPERDALGNESGAS